MTTNTAPVKWAQRKDSLYVTIPLADVKDHSIDVNPSKLTFTGSSGGQLYNVELEFVSIFLFSAFTVVCTTILSNCCLLNLTIVQRD